MAEFRKPDTDLVDLGQLLQPPSAAPAGFGDGSGVSAYHPSARESLAALMLGDNPSPEHKNLISGLLGSSGLGTGFGLLDMTPLAVPFALDEAIRARDPMGAALAVAPFGARAGRMAGTLERDGARGVRSFEAHPNIEDASRSARMYNPPSTPQRPFEADYPSGAPADAEGNLTRDIEGRPLVAPRIVGRRVVGGGDEALSPAELVATGTSILGKAPQSVAAGALPRGSVGVYRRLPGVDSPVRSISILRTLDEESANRVLGHELGHAIDQLSGDSFLDGIPAQGVKKELGQVYHDLNDATWRRGTDTPTRLQTSPAAFGYRPADFVPEYMAEAIRAYMADPNYMKTVAPKTAARIREYVNSNPRLNQHIQFNSIAPFVFVGADGAALPAVHGGGRQDPEN